MTDSLYYEVHVTIQPESTELHEVLKQLGLDNGDFRLATLLMRKQFGSRLEDDQFFTTRRKTYEEAKAATIHFCKALIDAGYTLRRYKIEDTRLDSKIKDELELLPEVGSLCRASVVYGDSEYNCIHEVDHAGSHLAVLSPGGETINWIAEYDI